MHGKTGIIGYYNEWGFRVCQFTDGQVVEDLHTEGNSHWDSADVVDPKDKLNAESLASLKKGCEDTCKEVAEETGQEFLGVDYDESEDEEEDE